MLNKDNLENGLQHRAASVSPPPPPVTPCPPHTRLPQVFSLLMFVLILLPESGWGGGEGLKGGVAIMSEGFDMHGNG